MALGAPTIRVWAGDIGSAKATDGQRAAIVADSRRIADLAATAGIKIAYEYHGGTLTDTDESAQQLLGEVDHANVWTLWQPHVDRDAVGNVASLRGILSRLLNVHVYHWAQPTRARLSLAEGVADWREYLRTLAGSGCDHAALLEFVQNDDPKNFSRDAQTLKQLIAAGLD